MWKICCMSCQSLACSICRDDSTGDVSTSDEDNPQIRERTKSRQFTVKPICLTQGFGKSTDGHVEI